MPKANTTPGLLSKMVKFVRNPATNWSELEITQTDREDALSKQLLKEMIERKRRNDFVRKREFDMLRKLRKREAMVGLEQDIATGGRPSFFQSRPPPTTVHRLSRKSMKSKRKCRCSGGKPSRLVRNNRCGQKAALARLRYHQAVVRCQRRTLQQFPQR